MAYQVHFEDNDRKIAIENNETILDVAIRAGLDVNYGCSNGNCGLCIARHSDGCIRQVQNSDYVFEREQRDGKHFLMCSSTACSDLKISQPSGQSKDIPLQDIDAKIKHITCDEQAMLNLRLRIPRSQRLRFHAGQFAELHFAGLHGQYSIASCPCDANELEFYFHKHQDPLVDALCSTLPKGENIKVRAPFGHFIFTENLQKKAVLFGVDLGFSAIKSLTEHIIAQETELPIHLYHNLNPSHHFEKLCRAWRDALDHFEYSALSGSDRASLLQQFQQHVQQQHWPATQFDFYLSAPQEINAAVKTWLKQDASCSDNIFSQNVSPSGQVL